MSAPVTFIDSFEEMKNKRKRLVSQMHNVYCPQFGTFRAPHEIGQRDARLLICMLYHEACVEDNAIRFTEDYSTLRDHVAIDSESQEEPANRSPTPTPLAFTPPTPIEAETKPEVEVKDEQEDELEMERERKRRDLKHFAMRAVNRYKAFESMTKMAPAPSVEAKDEQPELEKPTALFASWSRPFDPEAFAEMCKNQRPECNHFGSCPNSQVSK